MSKDLPVLYIKPTCPWCIEAVDFLDRHKISYRKVDILKEKGAREEMEELSGQGKVPTLDWHGEVLADFGEAELKPFLKKLGIIS